MGRVELIEGSGSDIQIYAVQKGTKPIPVEFSEVGSGKFKVKVDYPSGGNISVGRGGGISIISSNQSVAVINGKVYIGGVLQNGDGDGQPVEPVLMRVAIPPALMANLKIEGTSADLFLKGEFRATLEAQRQVKVESTSGRIGVNGMRAQLLDIDQTSGDTAIDDVNVRVGKVESVSGDLTFRNATGNFDVESTSGRVESNGGLGDMVVETVSGKVTIQNRAQGHAKVESVSGSISFANPDASFSEEGKSLSGRVSGIKTRGSNCDDKFTKPSNNPFDF